MPPSQFKVALQLGATVGRSFGAAVRGSQSQLQALGDSLKTLRAQQSKVQRFELGQVEVRKARVAYNAARREAQRLGRELKATQNPTRQLRAAFTAAQARSERLAQSLSRQREKLEQQRRALQASGISIRSLNDDQQRLGRSIDRLSVKYQKLNRAVSAQQANQARRTHLRGQLFDSVALGASVVAPLTIAVDFEQAIAKLGAITRASDQAMGALAATARSLGETTQFSASQAASAMTFLGMAGFQTNAIIAATPGVLQLAQAAGSDLAETADIASNILSGFSLEAEHMGQVGDVLTATFTSSNTTLQSLGQSLKFAAPVASGVGAAIEDVAAMAGLLGNVGIQGSMAGTALRATFLRLSAPPKAAADALSRLGIEVTDLDGNLRSVPNLLKELSAATKDLGSAERAEIVKDIFGEEASAGAIELLKQAGRGELDRYITELQNAQGAADKMASRMSATTRGSLKQLGSALESVAISVGSLLLPTLTKGASALAGIARTVSQAAQAYPLLSKVVVGTVVGLAALKVVSVASVFAYTFLKGGVLALITGYRTLAAGVALAQLGMVRWNAVSALTAVKTGLVTAAQWALNIAMTANPIGLVIAGFAALVGGAIALIKYWEPLGEFFTSLWSGIKKATAQVVEWLLGKLDILIAPLKLLTRVGRSIGKALFDIRQEKAEPDDLPAAPKFGRVVNTRRVRPSTQRFTDITPTLSQVQSTTSVQQSVRVEAPITVNAAPGMAARDVAEEIHRTLAQREAEARVTQRAALFDIEPS